jgi:hypothetical protein
MIDSLMGSKVVVVLALACGMLIGCLFAIRDHLISHCSRRMFQGNNLLELVAFNDSVKVIVFSD